MGRARALSLIPSYAVPATLAILARAVRVARVALAARVVPAGSTAVWTARVGAEAPSERPPRAVAAAPSMVVQEVRADGVAQATPVQAVRVALPRAARAAASAAAQVEAVDRAVTAAIPTAEEMYSRPMRTASVAQAIPVRLMRDALMAQAIRSRATRATRQSWATRAATVI